MNISITIPVWLIQSFLWLCVLTSIIGALILLCAWMVKLLQYRRGYWTCILMLTMRETKLKDFSWGQWAHLMKGLKNENPTLYRAILAHFNLEDWK